MLDSNPALTERQREIGRLLVEGMDRVEVARALGISRDAVTSHMWSMRRVLRVSTDEQLLRHLRDINRCPVELLIEQCRAQPRSWWMV
jgi:DNA-binding CsgD family transcriptional regulator